MEKSDAANALSEQCGACGQGLGAGVDSIAVAGRRFHPGCVEPESHGGVGPRMLARVRHWANALGWAQGA